ncbi:MAG: DUF86 domain-containing protein [Deltaproteobacteria bacterium]|nr:DUF86 domain-containing protein [Deltaproteobacteria bacterium]
MYCRKIKDILSKVNDSFFVFKNDWVYQDSISFSILKINSLIQGLSQEFIDQTLEHIPWDEIMALGKRIIGDYLTLDRIELWNAASKDIPKLRSFCGIAIKNNQPQPNENMN